MDRLLTIGISNAIAATVLAAAAWAVCAVVRKPAVARAVWLLVLLKLLTPPVYTVRIPWPAAKQVTPPPRPARPVSTAVSPYIETSDEAPEPAPQQAPTIVRAPAPAPPHPHHAAAIPWAALALVIWLGGSTVCGGLVVLRVRRFARLLRYATLAPPALQDRCALICRQLGLRRPPAVWLVPGAVCPMLWAVGAAPRVLIPQNLWDALDEGQRDTLLAHELAHLRRRDHWVRPIELMASVLYWWHPIAWLARRRLREAEEQCCDAWVVWALPHLVRQYATALLEAIDFVSSSRGVVPALASGMGEFQNLKRRLVMIKQRTVGRTLSRTSLFAVCAVAAVLPLAPALGQEENKTRQSSQSQSIELAPAVVESRVELRDVAVDNLKTETASVALVDGTEDNKDLSAAKAEVDKLAKQLAEAKDRLAKLEQSNHRWREPVTVDNVPGEVTWRTVDGDTVTTRLQGALSNKGSDAEHRLQALEKKLAELAAEIHSLRQEIHPDQNRELQAK